MTRPFATPDAAVRYALAEPSQGIDYARVSLRDGGHSQIEAQELRSRVLACLAHLPADARAALETRARYGSWAACARAAHVRRELVYSLVSEARRQLETRLRRAGLMEARKARVVYELAPGEASEAV